MLELIYINSFCIGLKNDTLYLLINFINSALYKGVLSKFNNKYKGSKMIPCIVQGLKNDTLFLFISKVCISSLFFLVDLIALNAL